MIMGERNGFDEYHIKISPSRSTLRFVLQSFNHDDILQYICSEVFLQSSVLPLSLSIWCRFCIHELHQRTFKLDDTYERIAHFTKQCILVSPTFPWILINCFKMCKILIVTNLLLTAMNASNTTEIFVLSSKC